uniref:S100/CaBP-9k-type calcium binding subdomain domain-containing protein n=1 Tax=Zosterops lateralis melanops TaxID=1220523 RepID=A0A8D2PQD7_ZOSLA
MPSQLEHAMETLMFTFHKYAGDKEHLAKEDLRALMDKEIPGSDPIKFWDHITPGIKPYRTLEWDPRNLGMESHKPWDQTL